MSPRHLIAALLLASLAALSGARRLWPERPRAPALCPHPFGVKRGEELRVVCLEAAAAPADTLLAALGLAGCGAGPAIREGEMVTLETACPTRRDQLPAGARLTLGLPVELNRASVADLEALPGIGPTLARRIVEERDRAGGFEELSGLRAVRGIGATSFARLRPWLCLEGSAGEGCER